MASILDLWSTAKNDACLLLDEVNMLLHPLHSELNFPVGDALPLSPGAERWDLVLHLLSPLRQDFVPEGPSEAFPALRTALAQAVTDGALQTKPHLLLLEKHYYEQHLKAKFAAWLFEWVAPRARVEHTSFDSYVRSHQGASQTVTPLGMQLLNLSYDWLDTLLPHVLGKVSIGRQPAWRRRGLVPFHYMGFEFHESCPLSTTPARTGHSSFPHSSSQVDRVSFGLLSDDQGRTEPVSRRLMAVPFVGKDRPSKSSQFAHQDILIGLTYLAYSYEGLRVRDLRDLIRR